MDSREQDAWRRAAQNTAGFLLGVLLFASQVEWSPPPFQTTIDASYNEILAHYHRFAFGREIIFTYGPLHLPLSAHDGTYYVISTFVNLASAAILVAGLLYLYQTHFEKSVPRLFWIAIGGLYLGSAETGFFLPLLLVLVAWKSERPFPLTVATVLLLMLGAWLMGVKFTYCTCVAAVVGCITLSDWRLGRRIPYPALITTGFFIIFWMAAGRQNLADLPAFLLNGYRVSSGYSEAMQIWGGSQFHCMSSAFFFMLAASLPIFLIRDRVRGVLLSIALGMTLFVLFKNAFVRQDFMHERTALKAALPVLLLVGAQLWRDRAQRKTRVLLGALAVMGVLSAGADFAGLPLLECVVEGPRRVIDLAGGVTGSGYAVQHARYLRDRQKVIDATLLASPPPGAVDLYSADQALVIAYGWPYSPRPIFQSYIAFTPELAEINANHLRQSDAPQSIGFAIDPIDGRLPALEDALSWPELLARYDVVRNVSGRLWLERKRRPVPWHKVLLSETTVRWGEPVSIPIAKSELIWAEVDIQRNQPFANLVFKHPLPAITVTGAGTFRFLPTIARGGFLLSPLVENTADFERLARGQSGKIVRDISFKMERDRSPQNWYAPEIRLRFYRLEFGAEDSK